MKQRVGTRLIQHSKKTSAIPLGAICKRLLSDRRGAYALEFAIIAPVFLTLLLATFEIALMFFASVIIEGSSIDAARQVRTGQAQESGDALGTFRTRLCATLFNVVPCNDLNFDVRSFNNFTAIPIQVRLDDDGNLINAGFTPGGPGNIVVVRVSYRWNFITPLVGRLMSDNGTNSRLLLSTAVFRNEPYRLAP